MPLLVEHFLRKFAEENERPPRRIARAALHKLVGYRWPGNVRELENEIARAASLGGDVIAVEDLSPQVAAGEPEAALESPDDLTLKHRVERLERTLLREALHRAGGQPDPGGAPPRPVALRPAEEAAPLRAVKPRRRRP